MAWRGAARFGKEHNTAEENNMDLMTATKWPIDWDALSKGDYIPPEQVEYATKVPRSSRKYGIACMKFQERLVAELSDRGLEVVTRQEKDGVRILDDPDATVYLEQQFKLRMAGMRTAHGRAMTVDVTRLDEETRRQHENRLHVNGWTLKAMRQGRREALKALPHKRNTPGLPKPPA